MYIVGGSAHRGAYAMAVSTLQAQTLAERVARCRRQRLLAWRPVTGGYTTALRLIVTCADGTSVFVKGATDARTATWLRAEYDIYSQVRAPFLPTMHAWEDDGSSPFLALEDLSGARQPGRAAVKLVRLGAGGTRSRPLSAPGPVLSRLA